MKIHNMMEDIVLEQVQQIFQDEETKQRKDFCTCAQCNLDVACFVLNRIQSLYMISGRGLARLHGDYQKKLQREADLVSLVHQGIDRVNRAKRPDFTHEDEAVESVPEGRFFNFPQITGRLLNSVSFEPICAIEVTLLKDGKPMAMVDPNWQNPCRIVANTPGVYSFWPYPESADDADRQLDQEAEAEPRVFEFEIVVDDPAYQPFRHYFRLDLGEIEGFLALGSTERVNTLKDLYLNPGK